MKIHKLVIPTPFYVGPVNVYLLDQAPLTLLDVGPNTEEAWTALQQELKRVGYEVTDIRRIVISHAHSDHFGLAGRVQAVSGARVYIHAWDAPRLLGDPNYACHRVLLAQAGVPDNTVHQFESSYLSVREFACELTDVDMLKDEDELTFQHTALRVLHTPGHTPGSICLLRESSRHLLAADTLLKHISPNPTLHADPHNEARRFPALSEYLCSIARLRELAPTLIQTGHGDDITDYHEHFHTYVGHNERRQQKVLQYVGSKPGVTAWELAQFLFPTVRDVHVYLAVSEAQANLDLAVADGRLRVEKRGAADVYRTA
ncbi:MAG: MBL fold metallo-hydrolase [Blastocatellia bacterium]|nr:MBL fold metallo-hydrolase [Blastocatellia bacterium]